MAAFLVEVNWPPLASNEGSFSACFPTYEVSISVYGGLWNSAYAALSQLRTTPPPTCPVFFEEEVNHVPPSVLINKDQGTISVLFPIMQHQLSIN